MKLSTTIILVGVLLALSVVFILLRPEPQLPTIVQSAVVWKVDMLEIHKVSISLPRQGKRHAWVAREDGYFYFDSPDGPRVDASRWGGGIPALLSGPEASRMIAEGASGKQVASYGLSDPAMLVDLTMDNGDNLQIEIGDNTPDRRGYYIRRAGAPEVFTVDYTWYDVLERLVLDPPYPHESEE